MATYYQTATHGRKTDQRAKATSPWTEPYHTHLDAMANMHLNSGDDAGKRSMDEQNPTTNALNTVYNR